MEKNYDFETKMLRKPLRKTSQNGDHCTVKTFKEAKSHWLPLLLTVALSLLMGQTWAQNSVTVGPIKLEGSTWIVPAGTTSITFEAIGGGGGGASRNSSANGRGAGGGGGAYAKKVLTGSDFKAGNTFTITTGAAGAAGQAGGNSIVKNSAGTTILQAAGGSGATGTTVAQGGQKANCIPNDNNARPGGTGGAGGTGTNSASGGGGGAAGRTANGGNASNGTAGLGNAPGGNGASGVTTNGPGQSPAADTYGGGGSGARRGSSGNYAGGPGAPGVVFVTYIYETRTITLDKNATDAVAGKLTSFVALYQGEYGSPINSALYKPTRDGWEFLGWFTQDTGGDKVESTTICNSATNVTLYAHWKQYTDEDHLVKGMQTFTSNNNNWRVPEGTWKITNIEAWGGGGAGGGSSRSGYSSSNYTYNYGGGGGSGAYAQNSILTPQNFYNYTFSITVGSGGTGRSGNSGYNGNPSSVTYNNQTYVNAGGGSGGSRVNRDNGGGGGAGGAANSTNGSVVVQGNDGGAVTSSDAGDGADAPNGGAGGAGATSNGNGQPGIVPGGGGGGAVTTDANARTGGAGAAGFVAIEYEILKLKVSRDLNYAGCANPEDTNVLYYTNYDLGTPSREGYVFKGWYNAQTDGTQFATSDTYFYTNDTTLYARWEMYPGKIANGSVTVLPCSEFTVRQDSAASLPSSTYRWFYTNNNTNHFIEGAQGDSLTDFSLTEPGTYVFHRVALNATTGDSVVSNGAYTVTVRSINGGSISASSDEIFSRGNYTINSSNNDDVVTNYKWGYKTQGESGYTIIPDATGATLTQADFALVAPGTYNIVRYTYIPDCSEAASNVVRITVKLDGDKACFATADNNSHNWIAPEGTYKITIEAWGGGGAGGNATSNRSVGSGGGGGGYILKELSKQNFHANTIAYTVGRGGLGGSNGQNPTDGNDSKVTYNGTTYTAGGGKKGNMVTAPNSNGTNTEQGGEGGTGDVAGSQGDNATITRSGDTRNPTYNVSASGKGGNGGGSQGGAGGTAVANNTNNSGAQGTAPGGGGSGARRNTTSGYQYYYGGAGGAGRVCITYEILELQLTTNVNYGGAASQTQMVLYYDTLPVANPTRPGYVFLGWYDASTGGSKVVFDSTANKTHALYNYDTDLNLYAQWEMDPGEIATDDTTILPCGTFSVAQVATAKDGATYKWFYTNNNTDQFIDVTQNNITDFSLTELGTYVFHRVALNAATGDSVVSRGAYTVTVRSINGGTITANHDTIAPRDGYTITSGSAEEGETIAYHWAYKKPGDSTYTEISGAEGKYLTNAPVLSAIGTYEFIRYTDLTNCNCDSGTATTTITVALESHRVCFETPGNTTWTAPEGTWKITNIEAWGAGGAGGNVTNRFQVGSGGGGGAYLKDSIPTHQFFHNTSFAITVGQGGQNGDTPTDGGDSEVTFSDTTWTAGGGKNGVQADFNNNQNGGQGGTPSVGNRIGNNGGSAGSQNWTLFAGAGGAGAGANGGAGGDAPTSDGPGQSGTSPGGGGSGAYNSNQNNGSYSGGAGGDGQVCITYEILELQVVTNANYGDAVNDTNWVLYYDTLPAPPTRDGYEFAGWYDARTDGNLVVFDSTGNYALYNKIEDMMLYAGWRIAPGEIETDTITILPCGNFSVAEVAPAMVGSAYKWFYTKDGGDSQFITGATAATLSQDNISLTEVGTYEFHRVALNNGDSVVSHGAYTVNVFLNGGVVAAIPAMTVPRANYSVMSAVAEAGSNITYQWKYKKADDAEYTVIPGATSKDLTNGPALVDLGDYQFIRYTYLAGCGEDTIEAASEPVTITVQTSYVVCFDTPGDITTWTAPIGTWKITSLQLWGGGAAGGDATNLYSVGSGGGGGAYLNTSMEYQNFHATPFNIKVANGADVHNDGDSSIVEFGNQTFKAKGGTKGEMATAVNIEGNVEDTQTINAANGVGGEAFPNGEQGGNATGTVTAKTQRTSFFDVYYSNDYTISASGAGGAGAGANGGVGGAALNNSTNGAGNPGTFPGGGGGGARNGSNEGNANYLGGTGASGMVCISYEIRDFKVVTDANYGGEHQYDTNYILYYDVVDLPTPTRTGFVFTGWYDANGSQIAFDSADNQAYYNFVQDTVLYAHWKVDAGTIGINDGRQYICSNEQYTIFGDQPVASNIIYSWQCTKWYDDESQVRRSEIYTIDTNRSYITERDFPITKQGLYVFTRFVQTRDDTLGPQPSANQFKIYVVEPIDSVGGLTSNYDLICKGGKVTLTPDWDKAKIKLPNADGPTSDTSLAAIDVNYEYTTDGGSTWSPYDPETTELTEGTPSLRAVFSYQSLDCKAYSKSIPVVVVPDPEFSTQPTPTAQDKRTVCPNGSVELTAGDLTNIHFDVTAYPFNYIWKIKGSDGLVEVGDEATYNLEERGKKVTASNFLSDGRLIYSVEVNNDLGCNTTSSQPAVIIVTKVTPPTVTTHVTCPDADGTYNLKANVSNGGNLLWYSDFTTEDATEDESRFTYSLADEGTYVWYVANAGEGGCNSARVPDSLVVRYTAHISLTSDSALLTQDTCQYEDIKPITFAFDGDAVPEVVDGTLPAGVHAVADASTHTYTISGAPTEVGEFDFKVRLQNTDCSQPDTFSCRLTVHYSPRTTVYFTSCNHESTTIGDSTFNSPGTYQVRLSSALDCDSVVTLIYNDYDYNQFGYEDNNVVLANWSDFRNVTSPISSGNTGVYNGNNSQITYDNWSYSWSYTYRPSFSFRDQTHQISSNISQGSNINGGNDGSLSLPSPGANGESDRTAGTSNGKSIVLKTKTKDYGQLSLQMDYQTSSASGTSNQSFSVITIEYSTDGNQWSGSGIEVQELSKTEDGGTTTGTLTIPNLPMAMNDKDVLYIRLTFDGAATAVEQYSENQPLLLDNITFSGHKGITDVQLVKYPTEVCRDHLATIMASEPYVECDEDSTLCDTSVVYYHWTKTVGGNTTELEELGNILVVPITEDATYTVTVGTQENCQTSASCDIQVSEPIDRYDYLVRAQSWCANDLDNFVFTDSESGDTVAGARISYPSIDSLSKKPGVYDCRLSIPSETACDSIIHLQLTVLKSYDTTIYANICLGDSYVEYGFNESPDSVGSYTFTHSGRCSTECDSIVTLHLTVNSVEHTLTSYDDVLMVAWPLNGGPKKLTPQCGEESVMRSAVLTFEGPNGFKAKEETVGSTLSSDVCPAATNSAIALYNGIGKSHYALEAEAWTSLESTSVLVKLNPTDYEPLKLSFDYNKSIDPDNAQFTSVQNSFTKVSCYYSYGDGNFVRLGNDVSLQTGTIENYRSTWQKIEFDLTRLHTLDSAELDIKLVFTGGNKGAGQTTTYGGYIRYRYFPAYLNIDNLVVIGDKPARAKLLANVPYVSYVAPGELASSTAHSGDTVGICRDKSITFTSQKDDAYFKFFLEYPDGTEYPFSGSTTKTIFPQDSGYYKIKARDNNGCDSVFKFYVLVNDHPIITNCQAPGICTDARFAFVPSGADPSFTYSWPAPNCTDIDNSTLKLGDHQDSLRAQLHNLTDETVTITYTLTPYMGGCRGDDFNVEFKVYPEVQSSVIAPVVLDGCPGRQVLDTIQYSNVRSALKRQIVWELDGTKDTVRCSDQSGNTFKQAGVITLPATPCDTTYKVYATYTDSARCIAKDTITLTVNIPAHSFEIAEADADTVYCLNHATEPDTSLVPKAYSGCGDTLKGVLVDTYVDSPTNITCEGTRTYTYKYTDCKGQDTTWSYVYYIRHKAPELKQDSLWPHDVEGQDNLYVSRDTSVLYSDDQVKDLYEDNCGGDALTVTHIQVDSATQNSGWKTTRIYTVVTACQDTVLPKPTMSVSGSDQTPPTPPSPESDPREPIVDINCCMDAAYTTNPFDPAYAVLGYVDNDGGTVTAVKTDSTIIGDNCSWTITYTYKVVDACGNELLDQTYTVSGSDQTAPELVGAMPQGENDINASILEIPAASTKTAIAALFTDCSGVVSADSTREVTGNDCDWTAKFCYEIKDQCNNTAFDTITFTGGDNIKPTYDHPADTTVYLSHTGEVDTTASRLGVPTNVLDNSGKTPAVSHIDTKTDSCGISYSFNREWHVKDSCGNDSVYVQKITVKDSITPKVITQVNDTVAYRDINGNYNLPAAFNTIAEAGVTVTGINIDPKLEVTNTDTFNRNNCSLYVHRTYTVRDTCNDSTTTFTHRINVHDTLTPRINGTWKNDTVYLTAACTYTLPDTLKTVAEVNAQKADFIKGLNLNPAITMTQDTTDKDGCGMFITRTYTVKDTCSEKSAKFTHKIFVSDTTKPVLTGTWPANITGQNNIYEHADTSGLKSDDSIKALFSDCHNITVTHTQAPTLVSNCGWTIVRTYHIEDACGKGFDSTMSVSGGNKNAPMCLTGEWPSNITNQNNCLANADTSSFLTDSVAAKKFTDTCGVYVTHKDSVVVGSNNCNWTIIRTYFVQDSCHNFVTPNPELRVSGRDQSAPVLILDATWPANPETVQNACLANADKSGLKSDADIKVLFEDCGTFDVTSKDDTTGTSCNWTITRTYTIKDSCDNIYYTSGTTLPTMSVSGKDTSAPVFAEDKEWPENKSNLNFCKKDVPAGPTKAEIKALFTDCNDLLVDSFYVVEGTDCDWTAHYTYRVSDTCGNTYESTVTFTGSDQDAPVLIADGTWPKDSSNINKSIADIPAGPTKAQIKELFKDCAEITVDSVRNVTGTDCDWTAKFCYQIKDSCHTVYDTVTYTGGDNEKPKFVCPKDTILNLAANGTVDASPEKTGKPTEVTDNYTPQAQIKITYTDKDTTVICGNTFKFKREWNVADTCGNDSVMVQIITVGDTVQPVIDSLAWTDSTVYWTLDTTYTLPEPFETIADVNAEVAGFITGNNLDPNLTMVADTQNRSTCGLYVLRTYTVKDTCNDKTNSFTHKIFVEDTLTPAINGTWKNDTVYLTAACSYTLPDTLKTVAEVNAQKADFIQGLNLNPAITMTQDTTDKDGCGMFITRTYTVKDTCNDKTNSFTHKIVVKDTLTPSIAGNWEDSTVNMDAAGHYDLPAEFTSVAALNAMSENFIRNCNINDNIELVSADTTGEGTCGLKVTRTYQVTDSCNNKTNTFTHTITVGDTVKPVIAALTWADDTVYLKIDTTYELPTAFRTIDSVNTAYGTAFITGNNLDPNLTMVADTQNRNTCGLQVVRTYTVRDTCNDKDSSFTHKIVVSDTLTPRINGTWKNDTVYLTENGTYTLSNAYETVAKLNELKPNFVQGPNLNPSITCVADTVNKGICGMHVIRTYTITDTCSHKTDTFKHKINVSDTITPRIIRNWADSTVNMDAAGHYTLPAAFTTVSEINAAYGSTFIKGNNLRAAVAMVADTQNRNTCGLKVVRTYTVTDSCNNKTNTFTHTITVGDTVKPVIDSLAWTDSTVYWTLDTTYTLPAAFETIEEVNAEVAGFITGNNLNPNLTMVADTQNRNTCGLQVVRTYTVKDTCNDKTSSFTHKIFVEDTLTPAINGTLGDSIVYLSAACGYTLPDAYETVAELNELKPNFVQGPNIVGSITLKKADTTEVGKCGWKVVRTYAIADSCSKDTATFTHTIAVKDTIAPVLAEGKVWLEGSLNQNALFAHADTASLADNDSVKKLFFDCTELTVTHKDDTVLSSNCGWKIRRTYTITDACDNKKVDSVFIGGRDQTKPTFTCPKDTVLYLSADCQVDTTTTTTLTPTDVEDNSDVTPTVTYRNANITSICGKAFEFDRIWRVVDDCGNVSISDSVQHITVMDTTRPAIAGTLTNDTVYLNNHTCDAYQLTPAMTTVGVVRTHSGGLSITDCNVSDATEITVDSVEYGAGTCDHYFIRTYTVTDSCTNSSTFTHKIVVMDTLTPSIAGNWEDSTVNMDVAGHYVLPAEFTSVAALNAMKEGFIQNCNISDAVALSRADTTGEGTCGLKVVRTYTVTDSCNNKTNTFTHTIVVGDTVQPVIAALTWADDTVYWTLDTTYTLPAAFVTIDSVNTAYGTAFITGNNLDPNLTMVADTQNRNTCGLQVVRTYTVKDTCNDKTNSFTHTIVVKDTLTPAINGTWTDSTVFLTNDCGYTLPNPFTTVSQLNALKPGFISGPNLVENVALRIVADTNNEGTCDWNVVRTYVVTDSCSNKTKSFTHTIAVKDTIAPVLAEGKVWLKGSLNQNALFAHADTASLADNDSVKKLFFDCTELTVTHKDDTVLSSNCGWKIRRTYTITDACGNKKVDSVFIGGGDKTKPTFTRPKDTVLYLSADCQVDTTTTTTLTPTDVEDNSDVTPTVTYRNANITSICGKAFEFDRIWRVVDDCGNVSISDSVQHITVKDGTRPAIAGTLTNDTVYLNDHTCDAYQLTPAMTTVGVVHFHSGDLRITDCNVSDATEITVDSVEYGAGTCDHYFIRTYTVTDSCNNSSTFTHRIVVMDTLTPSIAGNWEDSTVNMDAAGHYDLPAEFTSVAALNAMSENFIQNCNINDNIELVSADTTGEGTCGLQVTRTYQVTDSCSGKSKTFTHTIVVGDTVKPVIQCKDVAQSSYTNVGSDTYTKDNDSWNISATDNNAIDTIYYNLSGATEGEGANTLNGVTFKTGKTFVTWTVKDVCGNDTTCTDTIKIINVNPITVYISENTDTVTYDGQEHSLTGYRVDSISNNLYTTADFRLKPSAINDTIVKGTLAGSYSMNLDQNDFENVSPYFNNISFDITDNNFVIKKNPATITIASGSHTFDASEYDGQPHYFPSYVVTYNGDTMPRTAQDSTKFVLPAGDTLSVTPTGYVIDARETAEHNNTFTWELQHADCYANEIDTNGLVGTIHFNAFPQPIVISSETMTWTYDGNAHSYPKYTVKFGDEYATRFADDTTKFILPITGDTVRIHSTASITDAGEVANTFTYTIDNDVIYVGTRDTIIDTLYVLPLTGVVVTITENTDTVTYDGTAHSVTGYEVTNISSNLYNVADFTYNGQVADTTASGTYAGTYPMNVLSTQFANTNSNFSGVTFTIVDQDLVINPIQSNIQITAKSAEKNYDGTQLTEAGYTHTMTGALVAGDTIVAVVTGSQTEVGSSANVVTAYYVLRKTSAITFDTITYCYTFATPATVNGTLLVNKALAIVSKDSVDVDCYGNHNGTATIEVEGGKLVSGMYAYTVAGPNSYSKSGDIETTLSLTGLYPGSYTVTFKDGLDSTVTTTFTINQPDTLVAEITAPNALCPNQGSYPVSVTATGGNGSNAYVWGSNATNVNATSTVVAQIGASDCGTEYTAAVQVTDAKGCVAKDTVKFTVVDNEAPTFTAPREITLCRNADGEIDAPTSVTGVPTNYSDNCSNEATMIRHTTFRDIDTTGNINTLMVIRREWTVTDSCGNSIADTQRISIKPSIAGSDYVLTAPADIVVTLRYGAVDTLIANIGQATASHIPEGIATPEITNNKPENDRYPEGINYVVWTATDECGFTVVVTQTITVKYPPCDPVTYEGHEYPAVRIGGNCWLAENLRNTQYADQVNVPNYSSYNNDGNMTDNYGLLYSWYSAVRVPEGNDNAVPSTMEDVSGGYVQGLCPDGWALPKQTDYNALMTAVGTTDVLKDVNVQFWLPGAAGATPSTGFNARGAGYYDASVDRYMNILGEAYFWTSDAGATATAGMCSVITHYCPELINYNQNKNMGFSVRCIRKL